MAFTYDVSITWGDTDSVPSACSAQRRQYLENLFAQNKIDSVEAVKTIVSPTQTKYSRKYLDEQTADDWIVFISNLATQYGLEIVTIDKTLIDDQDN